MSKERARRRAEREAVEAVERIRRVAAGTRRARWRGVVRAFGAPGRALRAKLGRRDSSALGRQRARQNGALLTGLLAVHLVLWIYQDSWWVRGGAVVLTLLAWPLLIVLIFDRRTTR
jgi:Flp pilus assembly protein TadB